MALFRRRTRTFAELVDQRAQLVAELEVLEADAAWSAASDDRVEVADAQRIRRQADALRRSIAHLDKEIRRAADPT